MAGGVDVLEVGVHRRARLPDPIAKRQRGWNTQPLGTWISDGGVPGIG